MLRIKDNIDLKELEKFGFVKHYYRENHSYYMYPNKKEYKIYIFVENGEIMVSDKFVNCDLELLYDLIQADMVEKI